MLIPPTDLSIDEYHNSAPRWWSKTALMAYRKKGPAWFKRAFLGREPGLTKRPEGADTGLALDCRLTGTPEEYAAAFTVRPPGKEGDGRTKEGKAWALDNADKIILSQKDADILEEAVAAVHAHPMWGVIKQCASQLTVRRDLLDGFGLQSRPDWLDPLGGIYVDLKKVHSLDAFPYQAEDLGYLHQAALCDFCLAGINIEIKDHYLLAVEWDYAPRVTAFRIDEVDLHQAYDEIIHTAKDIAHRLQVNDWHDARPFCEPLMTRMARRRMYAEG